MTEKIMQNLRSVPAILVALALNGCVTVGGGVVDSTATIAAVQNAAIVACQFAPTAESVAALISASSASVQTAVSIAALICQAVAPAATSTTKLGARLRSQLRATGVIVNGVRIQGSFVRI